MFSRSIVVDEFLNGHNQGLHPPPAYFYCSKGPTECGRSEPEAILASIVRQISASSPQTGILPPVAKLYAEREEEVFASGPLSIDESISLIIQLSEFYPQTTIIIDALDECHPHKREFLLDAFEEILQSSFGMVKILVSSRDDHDIVCHLRQYPDLRISSQKNMGDIRSFVDVETDALIAKGKLLQYCIYKETLRVEIKRKLSNDAAGM